MDSVFFPKKAETGSGKNLNLLSSKVRPACHRRVFKTNLALFSFNKNVANLLLLMAYLAPQPPPLLSLPDILHHAIQALFYVAFITERFRNFVTICSGRHIATEIASLHHTFRKSSFRARRLSFSVYGVSLFFFVL